MNHNENICDVTTTSLVRFSNNLEEILRGSTRQQCFKYQTLYANYNTKWKYYRNSLLTNIITLTSSVSNVQTLGKTFQYYFFPTKQQRNSAQLMWKFLKYRTYIIQFSPPLKLNFNKKWVEFDSRSIYQATITTNLGNKTISNITQHIHLWLIRN